eukprot:1979445-Prorocentrum_lima.AAC.1
MDEHLKTSRQQHQKSVEKAASWRRALERSDNSVYKEALAGSPPPTSSVTQGPEEENIALFPSPNVQIVETQNPENN